MTRIEALRNYMFELLESISTDEKFKINSNFLDIVDKDIENCSLDKIPTQSEVEKWITGEVIKQDTYAFTSRKIYSSDVDDNLKNIGFYESFERKIEENNRKKILPKIDGISSIECLNCGALSEANTQDCVFSIQIKITYKEG